MSAPLCVPPPDDDIIVDLLYGCPWYNNRMPRSSALIPEWQLALIDAQAGGNRTAFMISAAVERAKRLRRQRMDEEIAASIHDSEDGDFAVDKDWENVAGDGID